MLVCCKRKPNSPKTQKSTFCWKWGVICCLHWLILRLMTFLRGSKNDPVFRQCAITWCRSKELHSPPIEQLNVSQRLLMKMIIVWSHVSQIERNFGFFEKLIYSPGSKGLFVCNRRRKSLCHPFWMRSVQPSHRSMAEHWANGGEQSTCQ